MRHFGLTRTSNLRSCTREARRRSDDRDDAVDANFNFGKREKKTLSQRPPMLNSKFGLSLEYTDLRSRERETATKPP